MQVELLMLTRLMSSTRGRYCKHYAEMKTIGYTRQEKSQFSIPGYPEWTALQLTYPKELTLHWPNHKEDVWLSPQLLSYLMTESQGVSARALLLRHQDGRELALSLQVLRFEPGRQIRQEAESGRWGVKRWLSRVFNFRVLAIGQFMVSGLHGMHANQAGLMPEVLADLLHATAKSMARRIGGISALILKDLVKLDAPAAKELDHLGYYQLPVDPSMHLAIRSNWASFDDYLIDISSKYRVRYRRARKQLGEDINQRELNLMEVKGRSERMYQMYLGIKAEADFDAIDLSPNYFADMMELFPGRFRINAYFRAEELIGFRTTLDNGTILHAHYLGFDRQLNRQRHLYHNMLFDLLNDAIVGGYQDLDFGRTALEIKSSVGAEPHEYYCAICAANPMLNWIIPVFAPAAFQATKWKQRRPFK